MSEEVLRIAKELGYQEGFEGENRRTPEEYIIHSKKIIKNQSDKLDNVFKKMDDMSGVVTNLQTTFNASMNAKDEQHKKDLAKQREGLEAKLDDAVNESDKGAVKEIRKEIADIDKEATTTTKKTEEISDDQAYFNKWNEDKRWIEKDKKAIAAFKIAQIEVLSEHGEDRGVEFELKEIDKKLKEKFPEKYGLKPKEDPPQTLAGGDGQQSAATAKALKMSDLSAEESTFVNKLKRIQGKDFDEKTALENVKHTRAAIKKRKA